MRRNRNFPVFDFNSRLLRDDAIFRANVVEVVWRGAAQDGCFQFRRDVFKPGTLPRQEGKAVRVIFKKND